MALESEPVCSPERLALDRTGQPLLVLPAAWGGLPLGVFPIPAIEERGPSHAAHPMLVMVLRGAGRRWYRDGLRTHELSIAPQQLDLLSHRYQRDAARWEGQAGLTVGVHLAPEAVTQLTHEPAFDVETRHELFDPRLQWLVQALHDEAQRGAPGGAMYAQGLSIALVACLREHYARRMAHPGCVGGLAPAQLRRVLDFVQAFLDDDLSIDRLAQEAAMGPVRFASAFKVSVGCTPHRWVQQQRVKEAVRLLKTTSRPIADIALATGFASQSHFTQVVRQATGATPRHLRATTHV